MSPTKVEGETTAELDMSELCSEYKHDVLSSTSGGSWKLPMLLHGTVHTSAQYLCFVCENRHASRVATVNLLTVCIHK